MCIFMTGTPEGSTESGFMEKLGIEPATPGLQDRFIHYDTAAFLLRCSSCLGEHAQKIEGNLPNRIRAACC